MTFETIHYVTLATIFFVTFIINIFAINNVTFKKAILSLIVTSVMVLAGFNQIGLI